MSADISDRIMDMIHEAKALGIPARRLYLGDAKIAELEKWVMEHADKAVASGATERVFAGMKIVRSSKPGMSIGL